MKPWLRRLPILFTLFIWALGMILPAVTIYLAIQNEITIGSATGRHLRVFLLHDPDKEGVGLEWTRPAAVSGREGERCQQTRLRYLMWTGSGENVTFCRCYDGQGALQYSQPDRCNPP